MITILILVVVSALVALVFIGTLVQLLSALLCGLIAGFVARAIMPGEQKMLWWQTVLLGLAGSLVAGLVGAVLGVGNLGTLGSIVGAVGVLWAFGRMRASGIFLLMLAGMMAGGCAWKPGIGPQRVAETGASLKPRKWSVYPWGEMMSVASADGAVSPWYSTDNKVAAVGVAAKVEVW